MRIGYHIQFDDSAEVYELFDDQGVWLGAYASYEDAKLARNVAENAAEPGSDLIDRLDDALQQGMVANNARPLSWLEGYCDAATIARAVVGQLSE